MSAHGLTRLRDDRGLAPWHPRSGTLAGQNVRVDAQTSIATILEFPSTRTREPWVPQHARPCTVDNIEFYSLKLIQHLCNVTCRSVTLWPSDHMARSGPARLACLSPVSTGLGKSEALGNIITMVINWRCVMADGTVSVYCAGSGCHRSRIISCRLSASA
jgi:hypothetical protein